MLVEHADLCRIDGKMEVGKLPSKLKTLFFEEVERCWSKTTRNTKEKEVQAGANTDVSQVFSWDKSEMGAVFWSDVYNGVWDSEYDEEEVVEQVNEEDLFNSVLSKIKSI